MFALKFFNNLKKYLFIKSIMFIVIFMILPFCICSINNAAAIPKEVLEMATNDIYIKEEYALDRNVNFSKTYHDIKYYKNDGREDIKRIVLYKPRYVSDNEELPLVFFAFYRLEEAQSYINLAVESGLAIASYADDITPQYFNSLPTDTLVFNNAALYYLKNLKGIDNRKIMLIGNSCGGYTALMLNALHYGHSLTIAAAPIVDLKFNIYYFDNCENNFNIEKVMPNCFWASRQLINVKYNFLGYEDLRWDGYCLNNLADCFSSNTIIMHGTGDLLVPIGQLTKKYEYKEFDRTLNKNYDPFYKNKSVDELDLPYKVSVDYYTKTASLKVNDVFLNICIYEDGIIYKENSHASPYCDTVLDISEIFKNFKNMNLIENTILSPKKAFMLLSRYLGRSEQFIAHKNVDKTVYGSIELYQKEVVDEFQMYIENKGYASLDEIMNYAIENLASEELKQEYTQTWKLISQLALKK